MAESIRFLGHLWGHRESRLIAMLEAVSELTLKLLNNATTPGSSASTIKHAMPSSAPRRSNVIAPGLTSAANEVHLTSI